jgi:hypothetical protein
MTDVGDVGDVGDVRDVGDVAHLDSMHVCITTFQKVWAAAPV